ncbi:Na+/H+ antiporter NhaA [Cellulomonas sp. KRMCY2]|uniref:Na+/H+ antiporter NhaA n=1 Tax=Cellulomonas sp. KRMCY2 TaxID=1304865 RepID=UPI00045E8917|nr:Na+/H+ antiporter NhaA [Cellulomonas sp. KRMCY2]
MARRPRGRTTLHAQLSAPLRRFLGTESAGAALLVAAAAVALAWANSPASGAYEEILGLPVSLSIGEATLSMSAHHWVNDGLMTAFFFVIGLEVRRELSLGELTDRRRIVVPTVAGLVGMVVPALLYLAVNPAGEAARGWGVVIGTDTAFLLGALAVVGPRLSTQLRLFLLTMTVIDDILAVTVIGVAYSDGVAPMPLAAAVACLVALVVLARRGVWQASPYVVVLVVLWFATLESGVHPSIAGMLSGLLVPALAPRREVVEGAASLARAFRQSPLPSVGRTAQRGIVRAISVNERLQAVLHPWTSYVVVPVFALANAGIDLRDGALQDALRSPVTWGVVAGLVLGKLIGISGGTFLALRAGWGRLPQGVGPGQVTGGAALSGIGFTVSLLIAGLAFGDGLREEAAVGVLIAAVLATGLGWVAFRLAAVLLGERTAELPRVLADPVAPDRDHIRGPETAPLTLVEYLDFECPFCAKATGVGRELREHFGDRLRYVVRHLPLPDVHPHAEQAAMAAEAAGAQGRFWEMHDLLFAHQDRLEPEHLVRYAEKLGLDVDRFVEDLSDERLAARIREDVAGAEASGARSTPTFFVMADRHVDAYDAATLIERLERHAARAV